MFKLKRDYGIAPVIVTTIIILAGVVCSTFIYYGGRTTTKTAIDGTYEAYEILTGNEISSPTSDGDESVPEPTPGETGGTTGGSTGGAVTPTPTPDSPDSPSLPDSGDDAAITIVCFTIVENGVAHMYDSPEKYTFSEWAASPYDTEDKYLDTGVRNNETYSRVFTYTDTTLTVIPQSDTDQTIQDGDVFYCGANGEFSTLTVYDNKNNKLGDYTFEIGMSFWDFAHSDYNIDNVLTVTYLSGGTFVTVCPTMATHLILNDGVTHGSTIGFAPIVPNSTLIAQNYHSGGSVD